MEQGSLSFSSSTALGFKQIVVQIKANVLYYPFKTFLLIMPRFNVFNVCEIIFQTFFLHSHFTLMLYIARMYVPSSSSSFDQITFHPSFQL